MSVLAKFKVRFVTRYAGDFAEVTLDATTDGDGNKSWSKWTPTGEIKMTITVPEAVDQFVPGEFMMVEFNRLAKGAD